jgi:hypothetical protein
MERHLFFIMAKQKTTFTIDLLQSNTIIEVVKLDLKNLMEK